jgi:hypothetical protein
MSNDAKHVTCLRTCRIARGMISTTMRDLEAPSPQGPVAIGACVATIARLRRVDAVDGARRGERSGGD